MRSIHTASVKHKLHAFIVYAGKAELQKAKSAAAAAAATTTKSQKAPAAAATTPDVASADVDPSCLTSWLVMQEPKKWLSVFVDHWVSDGVMPEPIDHPTKLIAQWAEMKTKGGEKIQECSTQIISWLLSTMVEQRIRLRHLTRLRASYFRTWVGACELVPQVHRRYLVLLRWVHGWSTGRRN